MSFATSGTIQLTNGSPNIVGTGTHFVRDLKAGMALLVINGTRIDVLPIDVAPTDDTHATALNNYVGTGNSGLSYVILPFGQYMLDATNALASALSAFQAYTNLAPTTGDYLRYLGGTPVPTLQNSLQVITDLLSNTNEANVASASTTDIGGAASPRVQITSTNTIASLGTTKNAMRLARFAGALTMTNGSTLVLPGAVDLLTAANDTALFTSDNTSTPVWRLASYLRANGTLSPFIAGSASTPAYTFPGDTNTGWFNPASDVAALATGGVEGLRMFSNRHVAIGGTADNALFSVFGTSWFSGSVLNDFNTSGGNAFTTRYNSTNARGGIYVLGTAAQMVLGNNLTWASGNVLNYDKSATAWQAGDIGDGVFGIWIASGTSGADTGFGSGTSSRRFSITNNAIAVTQNSTGLGIGTSPVERLTVGGVGSPYILVVGDGTANASFRGLVIKETVTNLLTIQAKASTGEVQYSAGAAAFGGFQTWYNDTVEKMRLNNTGHLLIGTTTDNGHLSVVSTGVALFSQGGGSAGRAGDFRQSSGSFTDAVVFIGGSNSTLANYYLLQGYDLVGAANKILIYGNGNVQNANNSYGAISDEREKSNIALMGSIIDRYRQIEFCQYTLDAANDDVVRYGVVARHGDDLARGIEGQFPHLVNVSNWGTKEEPRMRKGVDYMGLSVMTGRALQEHISLTDTRFETQDQKITRLEDEVAQLKAERKAA